jgi:hypothetical protein
MRDRPAVGTATGAVLGVFGLRSDSRPVLERQSDAIAGTASGNWVLIASQLPCSQRVVGGAGGTDVRRDAMATFWNDDACTDFGVPAAPGLERA